MTQPLSSSSSIAGSPSPLLAQTPGTNVSHRHLQTRVNNSGSGSSSSSGGGGGGGGGGIGGSQTAAASHGSRTMVIDPSHTVPGLGPDRSAGVLHLRGFPEEHTSETTIAAAVGSPRVQWSDDTVDNEGLGKKKSKVCCIFRKERQFGESDSDESCCSSDDSDAPNEYERMPRHRKKHHQKH
ncbi:phosphatase inhibitor-domain-containing protein [Kickxella alabastrina]|uniref:phosphatase inhibitor-domain-containing protein n=1 Tax=Kickxella alabastrina TaxID=61397 RepID=UPI002220DC1C|nr:phosphatase inhibitor-domain-containing protein [Kickxella alabastrina]KAI7833902.1 phosphatase inhibitor-domain-containing protein [Kickxella alabastrina]